MESFQCLLSVPLVEDHVHSLSQVVHGAVSRHRRVLLIAGPEGGEAKSTRLRIWEETGTNSLHARLGKQEGIAV